MSSLRALFFIFLTTATGVCNANVFDKIVTPLTDIVSDAIDTINIFDKEKNPLRGVPKCYGDYKSSHWTDCAEKYIFSNGDIYEGEWKDRKRHGYGAYYYNSSEDLFKGIKVTEYKGEWRDNKRHGVGWIKTKNNLFIEVGYISDVPISKQKYTVIYPSGERYTGDLNGYGAPTGFGILQSNTINKDSITTTRGVFKDGLLEGRTSMTFGDGTILFANFKKGKILSESDVDIRYANGDSYKGRIDDKSGKPSGYGRLDIPNVGYYMGNFKEGYFNGKGKFIYKDSTKYDGMWMKGKYGGIGTKYFPNGDIVHGIWSNNQLVEKLNYDIKNKNQYSSFEEQCEKYSGIKSANCPEESLGNSESDYESTTSKSIHYVLYLIVIFLVSLFISKKLYSKSKSTEYGERLSNRREVVTQSENTNEIRQSKIHKSSKKLRDSHSTSKERQSKDLDFDL